MPLSIDALETILLEKYPGAQVTLKDLAGDGDHYQAEVISEIFEGMNRVQQHRHVQASLKGTEAEDLHALALTTKIPA